ncbi:TetR/AcrR family transcriptional regulator [Kribbella sp. NPDC006257]|uniref:TetR/AcrR family transcriptional regulator n=1 Tax=Kribbella sp. NPDC006257 TaxID=3156738 RepID=UPI0033AF590D
MSGREHQKQRTRNALIDAYFELIRQGQSPSIAEVADRAEVSVATAYRYFPNPQSLRADAAVSATRNMPTFEEILADAGDDPFVRIETVIRHAAAMQFGDEPVWRGVLHATLERWFAQWEAGGEMVPVRSTARHDGVSLALRPLESELSPDALRRLTHAVMLVWGVEALVVTRDTAGLDPTEATTTMVHAAHALIRDALTQAAVTSDRK